MSFIDELKRRNVFRVGVAYAVAAWLLLQIVDVVLENINTPDWVVQVFMLAMAVGFPIALIVAWAFEVTPEGVKLAKNVDLSQSITRHTGHQLNRGIIMILSVAIVFLLTDKFRDEIFSVGKAPATQTEDPNAQSVDPGSVESRKSITVLPFRDMSAALKIHPRSTEALIIKANNYSEAHCDISKAAHLYEKAMAFNPEDPTAQHWYALLLETAGRTSLALEHIQIARRIDPLISAVISIEAGIYRTMGDYTKADELYRMASRLGIYGGSLYPVGMNYLYAGEIQKGKALIEEGRVGEDPVMAANRELFLQALTDPDKQAAFEKHIGKADESQPFTNMDNIELLSILGSPYVFEYAAELECPVLSPAIWGESFREQRKTPEFFELMDRAGLVEYWHEYGWPDDCASLDQSLAVCPVDINVHPTETLNEFY